MDCKALKQIPKPEDRVFQNSDTTSCKFNKYMSRNEFSRDRDRILFSKAFRRLQHKVQVYSFEEGDHFRTRLTHTLEVTQIARALSNALEVNVDLTEAIALGHDIGHTPFGHQGERTLDEIMKGSDFLKRNNIVEDPIDYGGFKHNYNSVRILTEVEKRDENIDGLNLTWQVLEGIFKHTRICRKEQELSGSFGDWDIKRFVSNSKLIKNLHTEIKHSVSIEGQIVAIADEIAQRQHDLDDGLRDQSLGLNVDELYSKIMLTTSDLLSTYNESINGIPERQNLNECMKNIKMLNETLSSKAKSKDTQYKSNCLQKYITKYFLTDVLDTTKHNIEVLKENDYEIVNEEPIIKKKVVCFSQIGRTLNKEIENFIRNRIINSYKVNRFDGKSQYVVKQLFKAYYENPLQLHEDVLNKIENAININSVVYEIKLKDDKYKGLMLDQIRFKTSSNEEITILIETLRLENIKRNLQTPSDFDESSFRNAYSAELVNCIRSIKSSSINENNQPLIEAIKARYKEKDLFINCLIENNYAFLSTICYHISGMTDSYAKLQFRELYQ
ncbi:MAG: dGTP triphosphohydrolase [Methanobacterium sp.]